MDTLFPVGLPRFRVLGPLEVSAAGARPDLGGTRQRTLLTLLLLESGNTVPLPRIVDAVWGEAPPDSAVAQVRICVSRIRRALKECGDPDILRTVPGGYLINPPRYAVDLHLFRDTVSTAEQLRDQGDRFAALRALRTALDLWYGPAASGLESAVLENIAAGLQEERIAALGDRIDLDLELGRHRHVVAELRHLVVEHPFRERFAAQFMIALYRDDRQAEALDLFRQVRRRFAEELGIEPSLRLRQLERAVLTQDLVLHGA